jgi:chemotaxis protein methyltransferase CheR
MQDIGITELKKLTHAIKEKYSYDFSNYASASFKRRILRIMELKNIHNLDALIQKISTSEFRKDELLSEITVNVTEMFRDPSFWVCLKETLPTLVKEPNKVRIWHAGCSSGEEVYSMLILLKSLNILDKVKIYASDIDRGILARAKEGKIAIKNMDLNQANYLKSGGKNIYDFFEVKNSFAYFDKSLLERVAFLEVDLTKPKLFPTVDFILCRNVLIYFNQMLKNEVLNAMHNNLALGGFLAVGSKETLAWTDIAHKFGSVSIEEKLYIKNKE